MPGQRRSNLVRSRRRVEDEGEEDTGAAGVADSQSEASAGTNTRDGEGDADDSDLSGSEAKDSKVLKPVEELNGHSGDVADKSAGKAEPDETAPSGKATTSKALNDTDAMRNGLGVDESAGAGEVIDFDTPTDDTSSGQPVQAPGQNETQAEKRRREHEEYKKKRDTDPAFIPNRGAFFMHDQRSGLNQNGMRPLGRGRGRGRGGIGGPFSPAK